MSNEDDEKKEVQTPTGEENARQTSQTNEAQGEVYPKEKYLVQKSSENIIKEDDEEKKKPINNYTFVQKNLVFSNPNRRQEEIVAVIQALDKSGGKGKVVVKGDNYEINLNPSYLDPEARSMIKSFFSNLLKKILKKLHLIS